jgi:hypothetical protein
LIGSNVSITRTDYLKLPVTLPEGVTFVKSPKGTGKTEEMKRIVEAADGSVLLIGHRVSLIRQSCQRLALDCYLDFKGRLGSDRMGICLDSLKRLRAKGAGPKRFRTVIIDESEQVLSHFFSDTRCGDEGRDIRRLSESSPARRQDRRARRRSRLVDVRDAEQTFADTRRHRDPGQPRLRQRAPRRLDAPPL